MTNKTKKCFDVDLINSFKVESRKTQQPHFLNHRVVLVTLVKKYLP